MPPFATIDESVRTPQAGVELAGLRCPRCSGSVRREAEAYCCLGECGHRYPDCRSVPCLIDAERSLFGGGGPAAPQASAVARLLPSLSWNPVSRRNYQRLLEGVVSAYTERPRILVVGGAAVGEGLCDALADASIEWVETDVLPSDRTHLLADVHEIPFDDGCFDAVVVQAVLEHVLDPVRAVGEIRRVLRPAGWLYAETPFMQQVHAGAYDFTRYTHLGHRRLFRWFEEVDSGPACGPGMALAWSWQAFLASFASGEGGRRAATLAARLTAFWLKYLDRLLISRPGACLGASSFYFLGRRAESPIDDRELIAGYRGL